MFLSAQISLYPLRQPDLSPAIDDAITVLNKHGLDVAPGTMSTVVSGEDENLFAALRDIYRQSVGRGEVVMVVTLSNACPVPQR